MNIGRSVIIIGFLWIVVAGCKGDLYYRELIDGYYLNALKNKEEMHIGYFDGKVGYGIINYTVFAVGFDEKFIVSKQHPHEILNETNYGVTNYYIIPLKNKISEVPYKNYFGPLSYFQYKEDSIKLGIGNLSFSIRFDDLK